MRAVPCPALAAACEKLPGGDKKSINMHKHPGDSCIVNACHTVTYYIMAQPYHFRWDLSIPGVDVKENCVFCPKDMPRAFV